ncbi:PQQ-binding-like beta-propeller repeat protein [Streptomyces sviceus]
MPEPRCGPIPPKPHTGRPLSANGVLYLGDDDGKLYALSAATGKSGQG